MKRKAAIAYCSNPKRRLTVSAKRRPPAAVDIDLKAGAQAAPTERVAWQQQTEISPQNKAKVALPAWQQQMLKHIQISPQNEAVGMLDATSATPCKWAQDRSCTSMVYRDNNSIATKTGGGSPSSAVGGWSIVGKKNYFEVKLLGTPFNKHIGVAMLSGETVVERWVLDTNNSSQYHIKESAVLDKVTPECPFGYAPSDTVGVLVDTQQGTIQFFINGQINGPGFKSGVNGPCVAFAQMQYRGDSVQIKSGMVPLPQTLHG
jgi:hypothetical protein